LAGSLLPDTAVFPRGGKATLAAPINHLADNDERTAEVRDTEGLGK
jgi:hypothetical protein